MIKVTIENDNEVIQVIEGKAFFGTIVEPDGEVKADSAAIGVGYTNANEATRAMATCTASIIARMVRNNDSSKAVLGSKFADVFAAALFDEGVETVKEETEISLAQAPDEQSADNSDVKMKEPEQSGRTKIIIIDEDGDQHELQGDCVYGCMMTRTVEGEEEHTHCDSFLVGSCSCSPVHLAEPMGTSVAAVIEELCKDDKKLELKTLALANNVIAMKAMKIHRENEEE